MRTTVWGAAGVYRVVGRERAQLLAQAFEALGFVDVGELPHGDLDIGVGRTACQLGVGLAGIDPDIDVLA